MTVPCNQRIGMLEMGLNDPNISPWHPPPITSKNLMIDRLQDLRKLAIKKQNNISPIIHTQKLDYTQIILYINKWHVNTMNALRNHNKP